MPPVQPVLEERRAASGTGQESRRQPAAIAPLLIVFAAAFAIRLWFNFDSSHVNCYGSCDASEYLRNAGALLSLAAQPAAFWSAAASALAGQTSPGQAAALSCGLSLIAEMRQSAPVFPLFILSSFAIFGRPFNPGDWIPPVLAQSALSALTCVLVALTGKMAWGPRVGLTAGLIAAFYPAFIINTGRLYSESFATFLTVAVAYLCVRGVRTDGNGPAATLLTGMLMASLQLTRSATFIMSLIVYPVVFFQKSRGRPLAALAVLTAGFAAVILPWVCVQKLAFGKGSLIVDRVGNYNFFIGNFVDSQGWLSYPYPDGNGIEKKTIPQLARESIRRSPGRWIKLAADKPARLFKLPWNDFRATVGFMSPYAQSLLHQLILLFSAVGICLALVTNCGPGESPPRCRLAARWLIFSFLLFHLVYAFFITVPRYNLTAMPFVILFAAAGLASIYSLLRHHGRRRAPWVLVLAAALLFVIPRINFVGLLSSLSVFSNPWAAVGMQSVINGLALAAFFCALCVATTMASGHALAARVLSALMTIALIPSICLPLRAHGRWWEWQCPLVAGAPAVRQAITIAEGTSQPASSLYLLVDTDGAAAAGQLEARLGGRKIAGPLIPGLALIQDFDSFKHHDKERLYLECEYIFDCLTASAGASNSDLRQWFLLPVPAHLAAAAMKEGRVQVELANKGSRPVNLYGAYRLSNSRVEFPATGLYSWEKAFYGVEHDGGFSDPRYDEKLLLPADATSRREYLADLSPQPGRQSGQYFVRLLAAKPGSPRPAVVFSRALTPFTTSGSKPHSIVLADLPGASKQELWIVRIKGRLRLLSGQAAPEVQLTVRGRDGNGSPFTYDSPWARGAVALESGTALIDRSCPLAAGDLPGRLESIQLDFHAGGPGNLPGAADAFFSVDNLSVEVTSIPKGILGPGRALY